MITLFAQNLLEDGDVTGLGDTYRLYDRDASLLYSPSFQQAWSLADIYPLPLALGAITPVAFAIDIDCGSAQDVSAWGLVNPTVDASITLKGGNSFPPASTLDTVTSASETFLRTLSSPVSYRYYRLSFGVCTPFRPSVSSCSVCLGSSR